MPERLNGWAIFDQRHALLTAGQGRGHPVDDDVRAPAGDHLRRGDVGAAGVDRDVEPRLLVQALVLGDIVAGELRLGDPFQLQGHRVGGVGCADAQGDEGRREQCVPHFSRTSLMLFAIRDPASGPLLGSFPPGTFGSTLAGAVCNSKARQSMPGRRHDRRAPSRQSPCSGGVGTGLLLVRLGSGITFGMPTILRSQGLDVRIYLNDHAPPHVHVASADGVAKIALGQPPGHRPRLVAVSGMSRAEAARALRLVVAHGDLCLDRWREIHG